MMPRRQRRLAIGMVWWCASVAGRGRAWAKWPGATGLSANQVNAWRALARRGKLTSPSSPATEDEPAAPAARTLAARTEVEPSVAASRSEPAFAALEVEATPGPGSVGSVSIEARGVTVRLDGDIGALRIAEIAAALRALR